ncbi:hypothetical protein JOC34_000751 [Virgibacillus halotolerans]|uniref:hypothetical protein n=1 Tax=Virgibacillus halotolerans TaxID=1071053 RepID=UPI0019621512|nr:hypothetical protein [Virgibacillus halotolerans]MBM7598394.1 hypothetical protein [Virgibacillus halotolerans]
MTITEEIVIPKSGVNKQEFEASLERISDQVRWMDQELALQVDNAIWNGFQNQENEISDAKAFVKNVRVK